MPKYLVTMIYYENCIIEAPNEEEAKRIACFEADSDDWGGPFPSGEILIEEYKGDRPAFNEESVEI